MHNETALYDISALSCIILILLMIAANNSDEKYLILFNTVGLKSIQDTNASLLTLFTINGIVYRKLLLFQESGMR